MVLKVARLSNSLRRDLPLAYSDDEAYFNRRNRSVDTLKLRAKSSISGTKTEPGFSVKRGWQCLMQKVIMIRGA
ncbi:hypothetical protein Tco_0127446 [Tanacetum coccineum]